MFCQKCGKENAATVEFCVGCGSTLPAHMPPAPVSAPPAPVEMTFGRAITTCFTKYGDFKGRAGRAEFWWFYLFCVLLAIVANATHNEVLPGLVSLVLLVPFYSVSARRLHDTGQSLLWWNLVPSILGAGLGAWAGYSIATLAGPDGIALRQQASVNAGVVMSFIFVLPSVFWLVRKGQPEANKYGSPM